MSREKNPQVYLTVTDGLVNKCGNNSNGVIVLAADTPGHTVRSSVERVNAALYIYVSVITFSSFFLRCYENNLPQPISKGPWFLNPPCSEGSFLLFSDTTEQKEQGVTEKASFINLEEE